MAFSPIFARRAGTSKRVLPHILVPFSTKTGEGRKADEKWANDSSYPRTVDLSQSTNYQPDIATQSIRFLAILEFHGAVEFRRANGLREIGRWFGLGS
jgi:hypothetical protein